MNTLCKDMTRRARRLTTLGVRNRETIKASETVGRTLRKVLREVAKPNLSPARRQALQSTSQLLIERRDALEQKGERMPGAIHKAFQAANLASMNI